MEKLIAHARQEIEDNDPEAYKVFLLAIGLGLRRKEIDLRIDEPKRARPGKTGTVNLEEKVHNVVREVRRVRKLARCVRDVRTDRGAGGLQAGPFRVE